MWGITLRRKFGGQRVAQTWDRLWNRGLPDGIHIAPRVHWPLALLPLLLILQLLTPSLTWITLFLALGGLAGLAYAWVRAQAQSLEMVRTRQGSVMVAGDTFSEEFRLINHSALLVLWAEVADDSQLPGYQPSRVVGCGAQNSFRWRSQAECEQRGVFRLGPQRLILGDPLGLFRLTVDFPKTEMLLVYPRVVHLPAVTLPRGNTSGRDRRRRPLMGSLRSPSVRDYFPGDSLRHVHWPSTARRGHLMVTEMEIEPSGDLWIVLDLDRRVHQGTGEQGTLEYSIILAASLAAELLAGGEHRAVGLLAAGADASPILLPPQPGQAQLWQILAALAPTQPGAVSLGELLHTSRPIFGRGRTVVVITPAGRQGEGESGRQGEGESGRPGEEETGRPGEEETRSWVTELVYLQGVGLASSVLLVEPEPSTPSTPPTKTNQNPEATQALLARVDVPVQILQAGQPMRAALTFRRTRQVVRTTPSGGVVVYDVEEEVG